MMEEAGTHGLRRCTISYPAAQGARGWCHRMWAPVAMGLRVGEGPCQSMLSCT